MNESDPNVMSYLWQSGDETILVVLNMSATKQQPSFDLSKQGLAGAKSTVLVKNAASAADGELKTVTLDPYGVTSRNSLIDAYELNVEGVKRGSVETLRAAAARPSG